MILTEEEESLFVKLFKNQGMWIHFPENEREVIFGFVERTEKYNQYVAEIKERMDWYEYEQVRGVTRHIE